MTATEFPETGEKLTELENWGGHTHAVFEYEGPRTDQPLHYWSMHFNCPQCREEYVE